ncbi:VanZ family protein [Peribacillus sp. SCS-155]|uniref:VanZ family protein n=1 Tax=Peribacillus sedimenti TaxID=3115297 RepID=UPI003905C2CC
MLKNNINQYNPVYIFFSIIWGAILFFCICVANFDGTFFHFEAADFRWNPNPNFRELFILSDLTQIHEYFLLIKTGHFVGFAVLELLLFAAFRRKGLTVLLGLLLAISTEVLQLYFWRDGRIYDMIIDSAGTFCSYLIIRSKIQRSEK